MRIVVSVAIILSLALASCQKEINWDDGSNGDLLVKALQVTPSTNDSNVITFQWDNARRLIEYKSAGKVNGTQTNITHRIIRNADGTIKKVIFKTSATAGFVDSTVYTPTYTTGNRLLYVIDTQYTIIGPIRDSVAYSYNPAGFVSVKETFSEFFSILQPSSKETYAYDTKGNLTERKMYSPNSSGGYDLAATATMTYDVHNNAMFLGEEAYISLGADNVSKNFLVKTEMVSTVGTSFTATFSQTSFNDYNRPAKSTLKVEPVPPGYDMKLFYTYI